MKRQLSFLIAICFTVTVFGQKIKTVESEYTYYAPENITLEQAKHNAIERARIQAIANEFGILVTQTNITNVSSEQVDFQSIGMSEVKGEWLKDLENPQISIELISGQFVITAKVKGKARELKAADISYDARILRNGKEDKFESEDYLAGDQFFITFQSPVNGYLAIYLSDGKGIVSCLLPYPNQSEANYPIKANQRYILFDADKGNNYTEEYYFTCDDTYENNCIYIIFSPNKFIKALDHEASERDDDLILPRELPEPEFQRWLAKCRRRDPEMQITQKHISIRNQH